MAKNVESTLPPADAANVDAPVLKQIEPGKPVILSGVTIEPHKSYVLESVYGNLILAKVGIKFHGGRAAVLGKTLCDAAEHPLKANMLSMAWGRDIGFVGSLKGRAYTEHIVQVITGASSTGYQLR